MFAAIESSNIVGYKNADTVNGNFNMVAVPFTAVDGGNVSLSDFTWTNLMGGDAASETTDIIDIWDAENSGYACYYYYNVEGEEDWWNTDEGGTFDEQFPEGLPAGQAFWVETAAEREAPLMITFAGAVEGASDVSYDLVSGNFNMISNPYPATYSLGDTTKVVFTNLMGGDAASETTDIIDIWDAANSGYACYYYYNVEGEEDWWNTDEGGTFDDQFADGIGCAFWVETAADRDAGALKITFKTPVAK
ncbi:MAG: hypothetical protein MJ109_02315 [Kiritimatiellae bacterium]|nr:hypothetical protein [Kiritimatiellia bacterium]